jgi:hypothetical protein
VAAGKDFRHGTINLWRGGGTEAQYLNLSEAKPRRNTPILETPLGVLYWGVLMKGKIKACIHGAGKPSQA